MKYRLLIILSLLVIIQSFGQDINKIAFTSQGFDEPPTKQGKPLLIVEYKKDDSGNFTATHYLKNNSKKKLENSITIEKERVEVFKEWKSKGVKTFELSDLGISDDPIRDKEKSEAIKTTFSLPENLLVQTDSFSYCQKWKMTKTISTGGYELEMVIYFANNETEKFVFGSNDLGMGLFDLKGYLYSFKLLSEKIPNQVPQYDFFSMDNLANILLTYYKTVECEGYYYNEFIEKNSKRSAQENRMMTGWDFVEYMRQRKKVK
ncbi:hypothetical protein [Algoriphagus vanfongensis]|uniref:hypothetical protein n=1 Tax=Algoriphagus vanfongensis TaxID=426371 RepID=UPI00040E769E|nr:hypothetical protein [Algoriphagus vanfongensis]